MWLASRGHHADIGGISPGSMPGNSKYLEEEGIIIHPLKIVEKGRLNEELLKKTLLETKYPVRNYNLNLHDIKAKIAANNAGKKQLLEMHDAFGKEHIARMPVAVHDLLGPRVESKLVDVNSSFVIKPHQRFTELL